MVTLDVVPLSAFGWDFRIESAGAPPTTLELTRFRDRASFTWGGSEYRVEGRGLFRRSYMLERGGVTVARAEGRGLFRRSYQVTAGDRRLSLRRPTFFGLAVVVEQGRERFGEIDRANVFRRSARAQLDDRIEGATRIFLVFLALVEWRRDARHHS